jgi:signal transduction histidine kinase
MRTAAVLAFTAAPLVLAVLAFRPEMERAWPARHFLAVHLVVEVLVALVASGTFAIQWYAGGARVGDARARLIGAGFLAVAMLEILHLLAFPGMPGIFWLESSTERGIVYWLSARILSVGTITGALLVAPGAASRLPRRAPLVAGAAVAVAVVLAADVFWISRRPLFFVEGEGLTPLKKGLELLVAVLAVAGALLYRSEHRRTGDPNSRRLSVALALTVISELCFMMYARAHDSFNLLGHVYLLLASYGVFRALFADAVVRPYRRLAESNAEAQRLRGVIENELSVTIRNLETVQEQQQDLLRAVSHDLRTPLQVVLLQSDRLAQLARSEGPERNIARSISGAGRQMASMIQDLVDAVHLESGTVELATQRVVVADLVREFLGIARGALETERVVVDLPPELPAVAGDPSRLGRVLQNVIGNALKYSSPASLVTVTGRRVGSEVVIAVADRGAGIPPEHLPRLFERFYRAARGGTGGGLGLGLYISRLVVEKHGGRIWCESRVGEGCTFSFTLRVDQAEALLPGARLATGG